MRGPEALALLLPLSRAAGLAPYGGLAPQGSPDGLPLSRAALLYSCALHLALSAVTVYLMAQRGTGGLGEYSGAIWTVNTAFLELIVWTAVVRGPRNLRDVLFVLARVKEICTVVKVNDTKNVAQRKVRRMFIFMMFALCGAEILVILPRLMLKNPYDLFETLTKQAFIYNIKRVVLLLVTTQFVMLATEVNSALRGVNTGLGELYAELCPHGNLDKYEKNNLNYPNDIAYGVGFINVKPKIVATFDHPSAANRLRSLASAYVSTCGVARTLAGAAGLPLFLLLTFSILNLMQEIFFLIGSAGWLSDENVPALVIFCSSILNCLLHINQFILLVAPCHDFSEELENSRYLVSHVSCEAAGCGKALRAELDVFFIHLTANQPEYSALGVYTLRRPLLFKVATFVITYMAVLLGI